MDLKEMTYAMITAFEKRNQRKLRKLNDHLLNDVVVEFSKLLYELAVVSYVLAKISSKPRFLRQEYEQKMINIENALKGVASCIGSCPEKETHQKLERVYATIAELEKGDARFLIDLVSKGRLKVASIIYAQGISLGVASEMTGMDKQDILDYAGKTMMFDRMKEEKSIKDRVKVARKLIKR